MKVSEGQIIPFLSPDKASTNCLSDLTVNIWKSDQATEFVGGHSHNQKAGYSKAKEHYIATERMGAHFWEI